MKHFGGVKGTVPGSQGIPHGPGWERTHFYNLTHNLMYRSSMRKLAKPLVSPTPVPCRLISVDFKGTDCRHRVLILYKIMLQDMSNLYHTGKCMYRALMT